MSNACGERSPDGKWRCSFLPPHGPRHSWEGFSEPAVLLRDTPEDRKRLARADCELESDEIKEPYRAIHMEQHYETADRIIAALRGER